TNQWNNTEKRVFGEPGRSGSSGRNGRSQANREDAIIRVGEPLVSNTSYDLSGTAGENGENGTPGEPARYCQLPSRPAYSLQGASGGSGGNGGNGGNGSDGRNTSIYYTDPAALKQLVINAAGGQGGQPGQGAAGDDGCECVEPQWVVNFCEWEIWASRMDIEPEEWTLYSREVVACTGVQATDESVNTPVLPTTVNQANVRYRLVYKGISQTKQFHCKEGDRGTQGIDGQKGTDGRYGAFHLIPRADIPQETPQRKGELKALLGQTLELAKNIWVERQDLRGQLNPASNVPSSYTYLQSTERPKFRLEWTAAATPESLGVATAEVGAAVEVQSDRAVLAVDIPGTLDYTTSTQNEVEVANITGGFSPSRVKSFQIEGVTSTAGESQLVLVDKGNTRELLRNTKIEVTLLTKQSASGLATPDYRRRNSIVFDISPNSSKSLNTSLAIAGDVYMFNLGRSFGSWLKPGYEASYSINIQQTTRSGARYEQTQNIDFQVPLESA
ncbi:MAG: hypothetical protein WBA76_14060, partial [Phormidesmis sp.]